MRILFAGATGVLGRATLPHLRDHDIVGLTRAPERARLLHDLDVEAAVCDVFDYDALLSLTQQVRPDAVVNFVTDLATRSMPANNRARREGGTNLLNAAVHVRASRLVVESVAFPLDLDAAGAIEQLEQSAGDFQGDALILRFGRLWGPGTFHREPPGPPAVHIDEAGAEAARLIAAAPPGTYVIT